MKNTTSRLLILAILSCTLCVPTVLFGQDPSDDNNNEEIIVIPSTKPKSIQIPPIEAWYIPATHTIHLYMSRPLGCLHLYLKDEHGATVFDQYIDGNQPHIIIVLPHLKSGNYYLYAINEAVNEGGWLQIE
jgi:hypothetical protein